MGASGQSNWRISQSFYDWTMGVEKRLMHEERRKPPPEDGHTYVDGLGAWAIRVYDWDDLMAQTNGYWYSEPGAVNSPDPAAGSFFMGETHVDDYGFGWQQVMEYRPPPDVDGNYTDPMPDWPTPVYVRRFWVQVDDPDGMTAFDPWVEEIGGGAVTRVLRNVATAVRTSNTSTSGSQYNILTVTLPPDLCVAGNKFRVTAFTNVQPDNTMFSTMSLKAGLGAVVGGTTFASGTIDHRIAARTVDTVLTGEYVYALGDGATNANIVFTCTPSAGNTSNVIANATQPSWLIVDQIVEEPIGAVTGTSGGGGPATPTGPAGGDLTGTYPNPQIADNAVTSAKIADGTITATDLAPGVVPQLGYTFTQASPVSVWTITHPLTFQPNVAVVDSAGDEVEGDVKHLNPTTIQVTFSAAFGGTAYLS
jgi:hypothetical protein